MSGGENPKIGDEAPSPAKTGKKQRAASKPKAKAKVDDNADFKKLALRAGYVVMALFTLAFIYQTVNGNVSYQVQWAFTALFGLFAGIVAWCFSGAMQVKRGFLTATGGFAVWASFTWFYPGPDLFRPVFVTLVRPNAEPVKGNFTLHYRRPQTNKGSQRGFDGEASITDLTYGATNLELTSLDYDGYFIDEPVPATAYYSFPISSDGQVTIKIRGEYDSPTPPTKESVEELLRKAKLTKADVLATKVTPLEKERSILVVKNSRGEQLTVWLYDCVWAYRDSDPDSTDLVSPFMDIRLAETERLESFKKFQEFDSNSGLFWVCVDINEDGRRVPHPIGLHYLFGYQQLEIKRPRNDRDAFDFEFTPVKDHTNESKKSD